MNKANLMILCAMTMLLVATTTCLGDLADGLVAYYPFNGNADDESGNGNDGTEYGGPSYLEGVFGEAINFDGVDDWVHAMCPDIIVDGTQSSFAASFWFKPTAAWLPGSTYPNGVLVGNVHHWVKADWIVVVAGASSSAGRLEFNLYDDGPPAVLYSATDSWNADTWYHVAYTHDEATRVFSVWVNGNLDGEIALPTELGRNLAGEHLSVARYNDDYIDMAFDELRLYDRALTADEIVELATVDEDGDGVPDDVDLCLDTPAGAIVDELGCSIFQWCPCDSDWKNHGQFVSCVAHIAAAFLAEDLISEDEKGAIVSEAAQSDCGKKEKDNKGQSKKK